MSELLEIEPVPGPIRGRVRPPGSKSITNRALVCAALADGISTLTGALDSEDTRVMIEGLGRLGIEVESPDAGKSLVVHGAGGEVPALEADLFCANSGTTIRFLTALATLGHGSFRLDGIERMRERPIARFARCAQSTGRPRGERKRRRLSAGCRSCQRAAWRHGKRARRHLQPVPERPVDGRAGCAKPVELVIDGPLVSQPYVRMTLAVMKSFGVDVDVGESITRFTIAAPQRYRAREYAIEPDASAASYFWAAAAISGGEVTVEGLSADSLQGDVEFVICLERMGCEVRRAADSITVVGRPLRGIDVDMNAISDTVQTLAVVALFAEGPTTIRNVGHIRHKETDRIAAVANELRKLGAEVVEQADGLVIRPGPARPATIDTYNDHRMAMSFALAGLRIGGVRIANPRCIEKTYPRFFDDLATLVGRDA